MSDKNVPTISPRKRRGWLRALAWGSAILLVLLLVVYFVGTSSAFFKGVILPKVSTALNATVTVSKQGSGSQQLTTKPFLARAAAISFPD